MTKLTKLAARRTANRAAHAHTGTTASVSVLATPPDGLIKDPALEAGTPAITELLSYKRRHGSPGELEFVNRFIRPVCTTTYRAQTQTRRAQEGDEIAYSVTIPGSRVLWCAHVDTVHGPTAKGESIRQRLEYYPEIMTLGVAEGEGCLGADDGAGCYILLRMIAAGVPGTYMFFRGEEMGGIGSAAMAAQYANVFKDKVAAIQFDRKGTKSIITEMYRGKTCSSAFANSLAAALDMGHTVDNTGSFTDTANLSDLIPECTNVSCGYYDEHGSRETLDVQYLFGLTDTLIRAFRQPGAHEALTIARKSGDSTPEWTAPHSVDEALQMDNMALWDMVCSDPEAAYDTVCMLRDALLAPDAHRMWGTGLAPEWGV